MAERFGILRIGTIRPITSRMFLSIYGEVQYEAEISCLRHVAASECRYHLVPRRELLTLRLQVDFEAAFSTLDGARRQAR